MWEQNSKLNPAVLSAISSGFGWAAVPEVEPKNKNYTIGHFEGTGAVNSVAECDSADRDLARDHTA